MLTIVEPHIAGFVGVEGVTAGSPTSKWMRDIVGAWWDEHRWQLPAEYLSELRKRYKGEMIDERRAATYTAITDGLKKHQRIGLQKIVQNRVALLRWTTGAGKTATALRGLESLGSYPALVVTLAPLKEQWAREAVRWAGLSPEKIQVVKTSKCELDPEASLVIVNYELLKKLPDRPWEALVFDECHYVKNTMSDRGEAALKISESNPLAVKIGLSATPITNRPWDLYSQLDILRPRSYSAWWRFRNRYLDWEEGEYGQVLHGLKDATLDEFNWRLNWLSSTVTKVDLRAELKPATIEIEWSRPTGGLGRVPTNRSEMLGYLHVSRFGKVRQAAQWAEKRRGQYMAIHTYLKETATALQIELEAAGHTTIKIDGTVPANQRLEKITKFMRNHEHGVLISTMHSLGTGVDILTPFSRNVALCELYWTPALLIQLIGRYQRLNNEHETGITILAQDGGVDKQMAYVLSSKLNQLCRAGGDPGLLEGIFDKSEDDFFAALEDELLTVDEETDEYGV